MKIILTFGCPRSGTTFMWRASRALGTDALVMRIPETRLAHPTRTRGGLLELVRTFAGHRVLLMRTVRHPLDIVESFLAARTVDYPLRGLGRKTDGEIQFMIREESASWEQQRAELVKEDGCVAIEARYERLGVGIEREALAGEVRDFIGGVPIGVGKFRAELRDFGLVPVRPGRLKFGIGRVSTDEERDYFTRHLGAVIKREGYEGVAPLGDER